jgi:hypothetical protein
MLIIQRVLGAVLTIATVLRSKNSKNICQYYQNQFSEDGSSDSGHCQTEWQCNGGEY